jgi:hypothetical protein
MRLFLVPVLVPVLVLALAGCAATESSESEPAKPSASESTATSAPTTTPSEVTPTPSATAEQVSCEDLLDPATVTAGEADKGNISRFTDADIEDGAALKKFVEYGGIACSFGQDNADNPLLYGYGPISDAQATKEIAHLKKVNKVSGTNEHGGTYFGEDGGQEIYVFSPKGYWAYQYNAGFGTQFKDDAIEEIVANAPAFY